MARPILPPEHYNARFARVLGFIESQLAAPIALTELACQAALSPYYFHRLFCQWQGETPQAYIRRLRLEGSAALLRYGPDLPVTEIAPQFGFTSVQAFNRAFHSWFGMSPGHWRRGGYAAWREHGESVRDLSGELEPSAVRVVRLPPERVIYVRKIGPYRCGLAQVWSELARLGASLGLQGLPCYGVGLDDPDVTPAARLRFDACMLLPRGRNAPLQIPSRVLSGGLHAILPYRGRQGDTESHWRWLIRHWLPRSRYRITEEHCFERFPDGVATGPLANSELCLPLRR